MKKKKRYTWKDNFRDWQKDDEEQVETPLKDKMGHCNNCGHGGFDLAVVKRQLLRNCQRCGEVYNTDTGETVRRGEKGNE